VKKLFMSFVSMNSDLDKFSYLKNSELFTKWSGYSIDSWRMQQRLQTCFIMLSCILIVSIQMLGKWILKEELTKIHYIRDR